MAEYAISSKEELTRFLQIESQYAIVSKTHRDGTLDQIQGILKKSIKLKLRKGT